MRVRLIVAYEGTKYCGWQIQPNGITIEEILNRELSLLLKEEIRIIGASRTDSGVHSLGNVAIFDTDSPIPADKISYALNQKLPDDIVIQQSEQVRNDFHPRFCKSIKTYEYKVLNRTFPLPLERRDSLFVHRKLDVEKMTRGAKLLEGEHDFKSFCAVNAQVLSTVRTIYSCTVLKTEDLIIFRITGSGFLYNMVRIIAGTLIDIGKDVIEPESIKEILEAKDRNFAGPTAPAHGLTMIGVDYLE